MSIQSTEQAAGQSANDMTNSMDDKPGIISILSKIGSGLSKGMTGAGNIMGNMAGTPAYTAPAQPKPTTNFMQGNGAPQTFSDAKLKEPGGPAEWTLREEPNFILAKNDRTGEMQKVKTEPLSPKEMKEAEAPHGAGPMTNHADCYLGGNSMGGIYKDMKLNNDPHSNILDSVNSKDKEAFLNNMVDALEKRLAPKVKGKK